MTDLMAALEALGWPEPTEREVRAAMAPFARRARRDGVSLESALDRIEEHVLLWQSTLTGVRALGSSRRLILTQFVMAYYDAGP